MKLSLIPHSDTDRELALQGLLLVGLSVYVAVETKYWLGAITASLAIVCFYFAYFIQGSSPPDEAADEYTAVSKRITGIVDQLKQLKLFLDNEQARIAATEATVKRLSHERAELEPLVITQRETVEAILSAHSSRTQKNAWKTRLVGFSFGVVASVVAAFLYGFITRFFSLT